MESISHADFRRSQYALTASLPVVIPTPSPKTKLSAGKSGIVYSQPKDTGTGRHWGTQLIYAVNFLKSHGNPIRLEDLAIHANVPQLQSNAELYASFIAHERVLTDDKTGLFSYKPDFVLRSASDLHTLLVRYAPRGGLQVKTLRESWSGVNGAIEELEKAGKILVTRTEGTKDRDGQMKAVFLDEVGNTLSVDQEFKDLWNSLKTPFSPDDLAEELKTAGLVAASGAAIAVVIKKKKGRKGGIGSNNRRLKITNTHLKDQGIDLSKDFVPIRK